jgi:ADP-ribose pyrophosphatase YjhB (NUDIX family)
MTAIQRLHRIAGILPALLFIPQPDICQRVFTSVTIPEIKIRATAVLVEDDTILLVEQCVSDARQWSLPGGGLEPGETLEACLVREVREETGLVVGLERLLYVCDRIETDRQVLHVTFAVRRLGGHLQVGSEPEAEANPIKSALMVPVADLDRYGFSRRFCDLAGSGFSNGGSYQGTIDHIGL